mmetsp:Transcript_4037/g.6588  ORF Transcript_4037/g.6588 Transcript_4037/m.6588 type:complete len:202 (+) Transcript_4037:1924-2529(+)
MQEGHVKPFANGAQFRLHPFAQVGVQCAKRLVQQHQFRLHHQRTGQRHTLLLTTRYLVRVPVFQSGKAHHVDRGPDTIRDLCIRHGLRPMTQSEGDVLENGQMREKCEILKDEPDAALMCWQIGDVATLEPDTARIRRLKSGDDAQKRCLARPRWTQQRDVAVVLCHEIDAVQRGQIAISARDSLQPEDGVALRHKALFSL